MGSACSSKQSVDVEGSKKTQYADATQRSGVIEPAAPHEVGTREGTGRAADVSGDDRRAGVELAESHKCPAHVASHSEANALLGLMAESLCVNKPPNPLEHLVALLQSVKELLANETSRYSAGVSTTNPKAFSFYPLDYSYPGEMDSFLAGLGEEGAVGKYPYDVTKSAVADASNLWDSIHALDTLHQYPNGSLAFEAFEKGLKRGDAKVSVQQIYKDLRSVSLERGEVLKNASEILASAIDLFAHTSHENAMTLGGQNLDHNRASSIEWAWLGFAGDGGRDWYRDESRKCGLTEYTRAGVQYNYANIPRIEASIVAKYLTEMGLDPTDSSLRFIAYEALQAPPPPGWVQFAMRFSFKQYRTLINPSHDMYRRIVQLMKTVEKDLPMDMVLGSANEWFTLLDRFIRADESANFEYSSFRDEWARSNYTPSVSDAKELVIKCFAKLMGVDLRKSPLDIWVIIKGLMCPLPPEWKETSDGGHISFQHSAHPDYQLEYHPCVFDWQWIARHSNLFTSRNQEFKVQVREKVDEIRKLLLDTEANSQKALKEFDQLYQLVHAVLSLRKLRLRASREVHNSEGAAFCERCFAEIEGMQEGYWKSRTSSSRINKILDVVTFVIRAGKVRDFREANPHFTRDDFTAIYLYTAEIDNLDEQIWYTMNKAMRENTEKVITQFRPLISKLDRSLMNLKGNECTVYRGIKVRIDKENLYRIGNMIYWNAFSSSSKSTDVAKSFSFNESTGSVGTLFIIQSISSKSIEVFSAFPEEEEYLFPSNTLFEIVSVIPESHLQLLSCNSDIVSMREVRQSVDRKFLTPQESIIAKLQFSRKIQFVYEEFLKQFICPDARQGNEGKFPLVPFMRDFATHRPAGGGLRTCVIGSPPGGGKSTLGIWVVSDVQKNNYAWNSKKRMAIPFFISLPSVQGSVFDEYAIIASLQSQYQLSAEELHTLRNDFEVILILDSLDEVAPKLFENAASHDLLKLNKFEEWGYLTVFITCREVLLSQRPAQTMFEMKEDWCTVYISPFAMDNIHSYIKVHHRADFASYTSILNDNTPVQELLTSPFLCWLIIPYLKSLDDRYANRLGTLGRAECYEYALQERMKKNAQRLQKLIKDMSISVTDDELLNDCIFFGECLSSHMFSRGEVVTVVQHLRNASVEKQYLSLGMNTAMMSNPREVFRELIRSQVSRSDSGNESSTFSFRHLSIMEFLVARALWQHTSVALPKLKHQVTTSQSSIVVLEMFTSLCEWCGNGCGTFTLRPWEDVAADLRAFVCREASGDWEASAAAFTLLCRNGCVTGHFVNAQLTGALLAGAHLNNCDLTGANLKGCDLRNVCFENCQLGGADLRECRIDGAHVARPTAATIEGGEAGASAVGHSNAVAEPNVSCVDVFPSGNYIVTGNVAGHLKIWNEAGFHAKTMKRHSGEITFVTVAPNGQAIVSGSKDNIAILWTGAGEFRLTLEAPPTWVLPGTTNGPDFPVHCAFKADSSQFATATSHTIVNIWSADGVLIKRVGRYYRPFGVAFSRDGAWMFKTMDDGGMKIFNARSWDFKRMMVVRKSALCLTEHRRAQNICVLPDGSGVAVHLVRNLEGTPLVIATNEGVVQRLIDGPAVTDQLKCSNDSKYLVTVHVKAEVVRLHDLTTHRGTEFHLPGVRDVQFTHGGDGVLAACGRVVLDLSVVGEVLQVLHGHSAAITHLTRPAAGSFATISEDGTFRFWKRAATEWRCCSLLPQPTALSFVNTDVARVQCGEAVRGYMMDCRTEIPRVTIVPIEGANTPAAEESNEVREFRQKLEKDIESIELDGDNIWQ